jgi:hypothetical protein
MRIDWEIIGLLLLFLFGVMAQASQASPFGQSINGSFIIPTSQTYMDAYFKWDIKPLNSTRFNASFRIADPMWSDIKACLALTGASRLNCLKTSCTTYLPDYSSSCTSGKFAVDMLNMTNYPLVNLTAGIKLSGRAIDLTTGTGWFYIDFPNGFKEKERAMAGFGSTTFTTFSTSSVSNIRIAVVDDTHFGLAWDIIGYKYLQLKFCSCLR